MESELEKLTTEVLKLPAEERAALAQLLMASLEDDSDIDQAWSDEVERRIADLDAGIEQAIPMEEALAQVRATLK
jgi:putative addiction module component (TIGR02574 family)